MVTALRIIAIAAFAGLIISVIGCGKKESAKRLVAPAYSVVGDTGSMRPTYKGGELIYIAPATVESISEGDIIVYWEEARQLNILHRVVRVIRAANGETGLLARGDSNPSSDLHIVTKENLVGRVTPPSSLASN